MHKVFIDGESGTTGLKIRHLLKGAVESGRVGLISLTDRRDIDQRMQALNTADVSILCLHDDVAKEALQLLGHDTPSRILDASSAHRTAANWVYGFPELSDTQPSDIARANFVSNPGCYATGAIAILNPLQKAGLLPTGHPIVIDGFSGYSGGGKDMIRDYEETEGFSLENTFRMYSLGKVHKHVPEIQTHANLAMAPDFIPHVINLYQGMYVSVPVFSRNAGIVDLHRVLKLAYSSPTSTVRVVPLSETPDVLNLERFLKIPASDESVSSHLNIYVTGYDAKDGTRARIVAELDNLGKGAAAQAVQNLNLMLGLS